MTARFEHEQLADVVLVLQREAPFLQDGLALESRNTAADDPKGLAGGVIVDGAHHQPPAGIRFAHRVILTQRGERLRNRLHCRAMIRLRLGLAIGFALLLYGTVLVFLAFDRQSHSASDTLRPFVITMAPVWIVAIAGAMVLLRPRAK